ARPRSVSPSSLVRVSLHVPFLTFSRYAHLPDLHSSPTRRSSDLGSTGRTRRSSAMWSRWCATASAQSPSSSRRLGRCGRAPSGRSEEHTSELQSLTNLVCRLLLEKKKAHVTLPTTDDARAHHCAP